MSNTSILIKRSSTTANPGTLKAGELAYSYTSNTLFFGTTGGNGVMNIGGQFYTAMLDAATPANTASTLVSRNAQNAFYGVLYGVSNSAVQLQNSQNFSISGGDMSATAVGFNGSGAVVLNSSLTAVPGLSAGWYGGAAVSAAIQVAANGRIVGIANTSGSSPTSFTISGNTGSGTFYNANTLSLIGNGTGIVTTATSGGTFGVTIGTDNTIVRSNTSSIGPQIINTDLIVSGNVTVIGSGVQSFNVFSTTIQVGDSLLELASNNIVGDVIDIGFYGASNTGSSVQYHGLIREGSGGNNPGNFYLFKNLPTNPTGNTVVYGSLSKATLISNLSGGYISGLANTIGVLDGGTGVSSFQNGAIVVGGGTGAFTPLSNSTFTPTGSGATTSTITSLTVDSYGRLTAATYSAISGLTVLQGGTGLSSATTNGIVYGNGTSALGVTVAAGTADQTWSNQILTVTNTGIPVWSTSLDGGSF